MSELRRELFEEVANVMADPGPLSMDTFEKLLELAERSGSDCMTPEELSSLEHLAELLEEQNGGRK